MRDAAVKMIPKQIQAARNAPKIQGSEVTSGPPNNSRRPVMTEHSQPQAMDKETNNGKAFPTENGKDLKSASMPNTAEEHAIFIGGLPVAITAELLINILEEQIGPVKGGQDGIVLKHGLNSNTFAFVTLEDEMSVKKAVEVGLNIDGQQINVQEKNPSKSRLGSRGGSRGGYGIRGRGDRYVKQ